MVGSKKYIPAALASAVSFGVRIRCQVMQPLRDMHLNLDGTTAVSTIAYCKRCDTLVFKLVPATFRKTRRNAIYSIAHASLLIDRSNANSKRN